MAIFAALKKNRMSNFKYIIAILVLGFVSKTLHGQSFQTGNGDDGELQLNTITTAVPFLMIGPDACAGAMGDVGAATPSTLGANHWNISKLAFAERKVSIELVSFTPWLRALVPDIYHTYFSGYGKIGKKSDQAISGSLRYFSLGNITFTDNSGNVIGDFNPNEFAIDVGYSRKLSREFSGGIALRFIYSNLTGGINVGGANTKPGVAGAADISFFYRTEKVEIGNMKTVISAGINISNIGSKMSYTQTNEEDFIPTNMRLGVGFKLKPDDKNDIGIYVDVNKLLVPTPPVIDDEPYIDSSLPLGDTLGAIGHESNRNPDYGTIIAGKDPNRSVPNAIFTSFGDAPGGSREELNEVNFSVGLEYWYNKVFAIRGGYFYEHPTKGNRQYFTVGAGIHYKVFGVDFAYLIPTKQRHPLENTLRFSLYFDFDSFKKQNEETPQD